MAVWDRFVCPRFSVLCLIVLLASTTACSKQKSANQPEPRLAVLRCENLSGDPSIDWMGRAFSDILTAQLSVPNSHIVAPGTLRATAASLGARPLQAPGISTEREAAIAAGANRIVACEYATVGGSLRLSAQVEDTVTSKVVERAQAAGTLAGGVVSLAGVLATQLSAEARPYLTRSQETVQAYAEGQESSNPQAASEAFSRAVKADPNFGPAYLSWAGAEMARGNRAGAEQVFDLAKARGDAISPYERARLALASAELRNDSVARMLALNALAKAGPPDAAVYKGQAEGALQGRRFRDAVNAYQRALALTPDDIPLLNSLGYAWAYLGDLPKAVETLQKYERLQPNQANPLDSQADVNFYWGKYAEAERLYLAAQTKDPNFLGGAELMKAAQARLATGDVAGADAIFQRYVNILEARKDPSMGYRRAQWKYLTGHRREAIAMLAEAAKQSPQAPQLQAQVALWELSLGDKSAHARVATAMAGAGGGVPMLLAVASFLTQPRAGAAEWETRAGKLFPQGAMKDQMTSYALLFGREFAAAVPYLRRAWDQANPLSEEGLPVLLGWAMIESGKADGASSVVGPTPIPQASGPGAMATLYFPRLFYLRARNYDRLGKHDLALENYRLFLKLAGNDEEMWGEEKRAREAVGR